MTFKIKILFFWILAVTKKRLNTRKKVENYQQNKLKIFAKTVLKKSTYYQNFTKLSPTQWAKVPQITKTEFMANFNAINTCQISLEKAMNFALEAEKTRKFNSELNGITVGLSTGTSGKRGLFLVSENERAQWVGLLLTRVLKPKIFKKQKIAFFLRANSNLYSSVSSFLFEFRYFDIFKPISLLLNDLNSFSPNILAAQPSILSDLADAQLNRKIHISPQQIISFAEVLHEDEKVKIETVFNAKITEVYQCTEGFLGVSCSFGTMHLNEDYIYFEKEWIDLDKFFPIITDFSRSSQPVVRYKLNDVLQVKNVPCSCGSPRLALEKIIGRDDDIIFINNQKIYPDILVRRIALECNEFNNYSIHQIAEKKLEVQIECNPNDHEKLSKSFKNAITGLFADFDITNVEIEFKFEKVKNPGEKLRKVVCKL